MRRSDWLFGLVRVFRESEPEIVTDLKTGVDHMTNKLVWSMVALELGTQKHGVRFELQLRSYQDQKPYRKLSCHLYS